MTKPPKVRFRSNLGPKKNRFSAWIITPIRVPEFTGRDYTLIDYHGKVGAVEIGGRVREVHAHIKLYSRIPKRERRLEQLRRADQLEADGSPILL